MGDVYDNVFRTLMNDCRQLMFPVLNEVFGEHYRGSEEILFSPNEHMIAQKDSSGKKRITDTNFKVLIKSEAKEITGKKYRWECQGKKDSKILVRFFEYDSQIALDECVVEEDSMTVTFPHSVVLYLRGGKKIPEKYRNTIHTSGGTVQYEVRILKVSDYTADMIFEKNLLFLLPFYIFRYERYFSCYDNVPKELEVLLEEYDGIFARLDELEEKELLSTYDKCTLKESMHNVAKELTKNYKKLQERLVGFMVGEMIVTETRKVWEDGVSQGISQSIKNLMNNKGISALQAMEDLGISDNDRRKYEELLKTE